MSAKEWDETSWWEQRILRQGLEADRPWLYRSVMLEKVDDSLRPEVFDDFAPPVAKAKPGQFEGEEYQNDLAEWGMQVIDAGDTVTPIFMGEGSWIARAMREQAERNKKNGADG